VRQRTIVAGSGCDGCVEKAVFAYREPRLSDAEPRRRHCMTLASARVAGAYVQAARLKASAHGQVVAFGQKRALIVWQRILLPDGSSLRIDNVPATDVGGYSGLADQLDLHTWQLLKGIALSTLLGVSSELTLSGQGDLVQAIRMSTQDNVSRAGDQLTRRSIGVQPTITIRPGAPVRLVVHKDLVLAPPHEEDVHG
jgi:type IV secretion system protein TrbI